MSTQSDRGRFVWYDLMTPDPTAATAFYTAVVGWGTQDWTSPDGKMPYTMWTAGKTTIGGMMSLPKELADRGVPPHWIAYISTPDVDATAAQAKQLGGKVLNPPTDIPTVGRFAVLADPQGAAFMVFKPLTPAAAPNGPPTPGHFSWHELHTTDHVKALEFYTALFGWEQTQSMDMGDMGIYQMYGLNGETFGGMFNVPTIPMPHWLLYTMVDNVDEAAKRVTEHGGKILNGPMDVPDGGRIVQCMDPQGAAFALHSSTMKA